jgi:hypothetical protein
LATASGTTPILSGSVPSTSGGLSDSGGASFLRFEPTQNQILARALASLPMTTSGS